MTDARCMPLSRLGCSPERELRPDRFADLLECMADLLVEVRGQRIEMARHHGHDDPRVPRALARLAGLERSIEEVAVEAASVHQQLQHVHII
jgi:hypothetical protein